MAMANLHRFQGLKAMDMSIGQTTAAFCSRPGMATVVIGVSLVVEKAREIEIVHVCLEIRRWMDGVLWHSHCVT